VELLKDPKAFALLTVIALRARRTDQFNIHNLRTGEALLGDHGRYGMTRQEYRGAQRRLSRWGLARFRATTNGTVATLVGDRIYDINPMPEEPPKSRPRTAKGPARNHRAATNKKGKKEKKEKKEKNDSAGSDERRLSALLLDSILERKPDLRRPDLDAWSEVVGRMIRRDGRTPERIEAVIGTCGRDPFWRNVILSPRLLRKHFDHLELAVGRQAPVESLHERVARLEREGEL